MKIVVCVKQVSALSGAVVLQDGNRDIDPLFATRRLNDPDRYAVEEALRLAEHAGGGEIVAVTVGDDEAVKELRKCLALGVHRVARIAADGLERHDPLTVARALAQVARREVPDLLLCGVQSEDAAQQATGPALASALGYPCVTLATGIELDTDRKALVIRREARGGATEVVEVSLPAVVTVQTGINTPRSESFKAVMMAKRATVDVIEPEGLPDSSVRVERMAAHAPSRGQLEMIEGGADAVAARIRQLLKEIAE